VPSRSPTSSEAEALRKLQAVTDAALAHLSLDQLLSELLERIRDALEADTSALLMLDRERDELVARAAKGLEEAVERGTRIPFGKGFAGRIAATQDVVMIEDVDHSYVLNPILREKGVKSLLGAPLLVGDDVLGVVHVGTLTPRIFTPDDVELLRVVAARAAIAIDRALAYEELLRMTELQREFVALAAHELRTPATTVYGLAATLAQRELPAELVEELQQTLHSQAERMSRLVEQLLDMSRLDAASIPLNPEPIALKAELEQIVRGNALGASTSSRSTSPRARPSWPTAPSSSASSATSSRMPSATANRRCASSRASTTRTSDSPSRTAARGSTRNSSRTSSTASSAATPPARREREPASASRSRASTPARTEATWSTSPTPRGPASTSSSRRSGGRSA
jgi:GAF domain-containing protein